MNSFGEFRDALDLFDVGPGAHDMCVLCEVVSLISKNIDFYLFGCVLSIITTFVFYPFEFEDQKSRFSRKRAKMTFHTKSVHKFRNLQIMGKIYLLQTKFFDDQLCLLRRSHSGPTNDVSNYVKFYN